MCMYKITKIVTVKIRIFVLKIKCCFIIGHSLGSKIKYNNLEKKMGADCSE